MRRPGCFIRFTGLAGLLLAGPGLLYGESVETIVVHPGKVVKLSPAAKIETGIRPSPRTGDIRKTARVTGVAVDKRSDPADPEVNKFYNPAAGGRKVRTFEKAEGIKAAESGNVIQILAEEKAAGERFVLTAYITVSQEEYKKLSRIENGKEIKSNAWVKLPDDSQQQEITIAVALGTLPTVLVPPVGATTVKLPRTLVDVELTGPSSPYARAEKAPGNQILVTALKPGTAKLNFKYKLAGKSLKAILPVTVETEARVLPVDLALGASQVIAIEPLDGLLGLREGKILAIDSAPDEAIALVSLEARGIKVTGRREGKTLAVVSYEGLENSKKPKRFLAQITIEIKVADPQSPK